MKNHLLLFAFLCLNFVIFAQELPEILKTKQFTRGIYKDFGEFLENAPSIKTAFHVSTRSTEEKIESGEGMYYLVMDGSSSENSTECWGFSDGESIYVNEHNYVVYETAIADFHVGFGFRKILGVGRYCYHRGIFYQEIMQAKIPLFGLYVLNINNGNFFHVKKDILNTILKKDSELLSQFKAERKENREEDVELKYIKKYNEKYLNESTIYAKDSIHIIFYRQDEIDGLPLKVALYDSLNFDLKPNSTYKFSCLKKVIKICLEYGECRVIALNAKEINYFECTWPNESDVPEIRKMEAKLGDFYSRKIKH